MVSVVTEEAAAGKPKRKLVRDVMRVKHYSLRTERTYWEWIERYICFYAMRHPSEMGEAELVTFLTHPAREGKVAASMQND